MLDPRFPPIPSLAILQDAATPERGRRLPPDHAPLRIGQAQALLERVTRAVTKTLSWRVVPGRRGNLAPLCVRASIERLPEPRRARGGAVLRVDIGGAAMTPLARCPRSIFEPFAFAALCLALGRARLERYGGQLLSTRRDDSQLLTLRLPFTR